MEFAFAPIVVVQVPHSVQFAGLMVFVLLIGGTLGWIAYRARVQRDVVAAIEQADGSVWYEWERRMANLLSMAGPPGRSGWSIA